MDLRQRHGVPTGRGELASNPFPQPGETVGEIGKGAEGEIAGKVVQTPAPRPERVSKEVVLQGRAVMVGEHGAPGARP